MANPLGEHSEPPQHATQERDGDNERFGSYGKDGLKRIALRDGHHGVVLYRTVGQCASATSFGMRLTRPAARLAAASANWHTAEWACFA